MRDMQRITTFSPLQKILSSFLNSLQDAVHPITTMDGFLRGGKINAPGTTTVYIDDVSGLVIGNNHGTATGLTSITVSSLTADTWYYVYLYFSGGAVTREVSTTAPTGIWKTGDATKRFTGAFRTWNDGGTVRVIPFATLPGNRVRYWPYDPGLVSGAFDVGAVANSTTPPHSQDDTIVCDGLVPPHSRTAMVRALYSMSGIEPTTPSLLRIRDGDVVTSTSNGLAFYLSAEDDAMVYLNCGDVGLDASQSFVARTETVSQTVDVSFFVDGYVEDSRND